MGEKLYKAQLLSSELLELAERKEEAAYIVEAKRVHGMTLLYLGDFTGSRSYMESALELHDPEQHKLHAVRYGLDPLICCESYLAYALLFLGYRDQAIRKSREVVSAAKALEHPYTYTFSLAFAAFLRQHLGDMNATRDLATIAIQISDENGFQFWAKQQSVLQSWAKAELGETEVGMLEMRNALNAYLELGPVLESSRFLSLMAEFYTKGGRTDESLAMLKNAMNTANETGVLMVGGAEHPNQ